MLIPSQLYRQVLAKDRATQQIELVSRSVNVFTTAVLTQSQQLFVMPLDRIGILSAAAVSLQQLVSTDNLVSWRLAVGNQGILASGSPQTPFSAPSINTLSWSGQLWLHPGSAVIIDATFSGIGAGAALSFAIQAVTFPRGNIAIS